MSVIELIIGYAVGLLLFLMRYPFALVTLAFLAFATYYDEKEREIDSKLFLAVIPPAMVTYAIIYSFGMLDIEGLVATAITTAVIAGTTYVLSRAGIMGFGDVLIMLVVGALNPKVLRFGSLVLTPLALSVLLGAFYLVFVVILNLVHNLRRLNEFKEAIRGAGGGSSIYYMLVGRVMTAEEFKRSKFYFPLVAGGMKRKIAKVGVEPMEGAEHSIEGEYVIATKGMPFATAMMIGYFLTFVLMFQDFINGLMRPCGA